MFIRDHPYPETIQGVQSLIRQPTPSCYTEDMHQEFPKVYKFVSRNTFKIYGREFGNLLYDTGKVVGMELAVG